MSRNSQYESILDSFHADYTFKPNVQLTSVNHKLSLQNQARLLGAGRIDQDFVERYRTAIENGADMPPLVGYGQPSGVILIDGNHRLAALEAAGRTTHDMYIVHNNDEIFIKEITRIFNMMITGKQASRLEALEHACYFIERHGRTIADAARLVNLPVSALENELRARETKKRLVKIGVAVPELSETHLRQMATVPTDTGLKAVYEAAKESGVGSSTAPFRDLLNDVRKAHSEAEQVAAVEQWRQRNDVRHQIVATHGGAIRAPRLPGDELRAAVARLQTVATKLQAQRKDGSATGYDAERTKALMSDWQACRAVVEACFGNATAR